ncbi:MAG TPA: ATP-grasp fold amidoligase family protein [Nitrospira sp.]|nr:ATP-grasp fold amidoligase family protein [Nitrospira sp.]
MKHSTAQTWTTNFQDQLRGTWVHRLYNDVRKAKRSLLRRSEGEAILLERYHRVHGKPLNVIAPKTFTEKLFWRMISWNRGVNPLFTQLSDKYAARTHVAGTIGDEYLITLLWHGEHPQTIPFNRLPARYVMKPSHTSQQVIVVRGHATRADLISRASDWLDSNYYWNAREYQYYRIKPRVMIEECLENPDGSLPLDYKLWCFNGVPELIQVITHTRDMSSFFDRTWTLLDLSNKEGRSQRPMTKPENLEEMIAIASKLSVGFGFVRVDLYNVNGRIYFGELTFTPTAGNMKLQPDSWDAALGGKWDLSLEDRAPSGGACPLLN